MAWEKDDQSSNERRRIQELKQELREDRSFNQNGDKHGKGKNMEWMYKGPSALVNREDYLLGKKIDKQLENLSKKGNKDSSKPATPKPIFGDATTPGLAVDISNKIREDPLLMIRKREEQSKKDLLNNPVKLKQLQALLHDEPASRKKTRKKHRHKRSSSDDCHDSDHTRHRGASPSRQRHHEKRTGDRRDRTKISGSHHRGRHRHGSSSDDDAEKIAKYGQRTRHDARTGQKARNRHYSDKDTASCSRHHGRHQARGSKYIAEDSAHKSKKRSSSSSEQSDDERGQLDQSNRLKRLHGYARDGGSKRHHSDDSNDEDRHRMSQKSYGLIMPKGHSGTQVRDMKIQKLKQRSRSKSPVAKKYRPEPRKKLSSEEIERKRMEMMDNAKWREETRSANIRQYKEEDERENQRHAKHKSRGAEFINPMMAESVGGSTVEDRIKRKIHSVQRTKADMDKNFTRR